MEIRAYFNSNNNKISQIINQFNKTKAIKVSWDRIKTIISR